MYMYFVLAIANVLAIDILKIREKIVNGQKLTLALLK